MARILIVDDSLFIRKTMREFLKAGSHDVAGEAENSEQALTLYRELKPDLVTMDIIMPRESGLEAIRRIREYDPNARIVVVSAMGQKKVVSQALELGAKGMVLKPVRAAELLARIAEALA